MSLTKFYIARYNRLQITMETVERETDNSVWIGGRRVKKQSEWRCYFDTWEQAHAHLLDDAETYVDHCRRELKLANSRLGNVKGMKRPAPSPVERAI